MRVVVTGANGHIGSNIVRVLMEQGHSVVALVRPRADRRALDGLAVDVREGDILDARVSRRRSMVPTSSFMRRHRTATSRPTRTSSSGPPSTERATSSTRARRRRCAAWCSPRAPRRSALQRRARSPSTSAIRSGPRTRRVVAGAKGSLDGRGRVDHARDARRRARPASRLRLDEVPAAARHDVPAGGRCDPRLGELAPRSGSAQGVGGQTRAVDAAADVATQRPSAHAAPLPIAITTLAWRAVSRIVRSVAVTARPRPRMREHAVEGSTR